MVDWSKKRVIVTGGAGFFGSHLVDLLTERRCEPFVPRSSEYDLRYPWDGVYKMFHHFGQPIDYVFHFAANVGGIGYNLNHPFDLCHDNLLMGLHLVEESVERRVGKFIQIGTVCAYPKWARPPFSENGLWDGYPEETNAPYGLAKRMMWTVLDAARRQYGLNGIYLLPTNLYGPRDNFHPEDSHVIPALIRKCVEARDRGADSIQVWGTGRATRDFLYVEDAARGVLLAAEKYNRHEPMNLGSGEEISIAALLHLIKKIVGFEGREVWDANKPDGQPRRVLNISRAYNLLGWEANTSLEDGLRKTIEWFEENYQMEAEPCPVLA